MNLAWVHDPLLLLVNALATFRLTWLTARDSFPPIARIRDHVLDRWGASPWSDLADCPWCQGVWWAAGVTLVASSPAGTAWMWVAVPLAMAAVVGLLATLSD